MVPLNYFNLYNQALKFSLSNWALLVKLSPKLFALMGELGGSKANEQKNIIREMEQSSAWERDQLFAGLSQDNSAWMHDWDRLRHCKSCLSCFFCQDQPADPNPQDYPAPLQSNPPCAQHAPMEREREKMAAIIPIHFHLPIHQYYMIWIIGS